MNEQEIITHLQEQFGAIPVTSQLDEEQERFLDRRMEIEEQLSWSLDAFVEHNSLILAYGLEEKLLEKIAEYIQMLIDYEPFKIELMESEFYRRFGDRRAIKDLLIRNNVEYNHE